MDYNASACKILQAVGGKDNVNFVSHCATRLRITLKDGKKADAEALKKVEGVLGIVNHGTEYQVIIGTDVGLVYDAFLGLGNFTARGTIDDPKASKEDAKLASGNNKWFKTATDFIAGSVLPALPVLVGGGMIRAVLVLCSSLFGLSDQSGTYIILNAIYNAAFTFLPIWVGYNAAAKLHTEPFLGALLGAVLVCGDVNGVEGLNFLGIPVPAVGYGSSIIPALLGVLFMSVVWKPLNRKIPKEVKFFVVPLVTMAVTVPVTLLVLGPLGNWVGTLLGAALEWLNVHLGWLSVGILGGTFALMLLTGTGYGLYPIVLTAFAENGFDTFCQPAGLAANLAVGGAAIAVMTMLTDKEQKGMALSSGLTAVFGITEPAIFGVLANYKRPLLGSAIGGAVGGVFAGLFHVAEYAMASPGIASLIAFMNPDGTMGNITFAALTAIIAFVVSFIATRAIGLKSEE